MSTKKEVKQRLIPQKNEQPNLLKHSEERYQALFNSMTDMFQVFELVYDSKGKPIDCYFREVNPALEQLTGKTSAQLIGKKVRDLFHFEDYWLERYHRILTTGESESFEDYGKEFDKYYKVIAWKVGENKIASIYTDITTQKNAENSLKQAKDNQYKMLFDSMTELVQTIELTYSKEGRPLDYYIRDINTSFASFLGKTKKEIINKKISSVVNRIEESWLNTFAEVENTGTAISFEDYASDFNKYFYCTAWKISKNLLGVSLTDITQQYIEKETRAGELANANKKLAFRNKEKEQRTNDWAIANAELAFQNEEKEKRANELALANTELAFQNEEKEKRANELALANTELAFQNEEKEKRADELALANTELAFQNKEKEKRADELAVANTELAFQNEEKEKRANELALANTELAFQNEEKEKRADELAVANTELSFQSDEKEKRANELDIANKELAFQSNEKEKRVNELDIANKELSFQSNEKEKRANELDIANKELAFQSDEKEKRANELDIANKELAFQNNEKEKRANELAIAKKELAFQKKLDGYRSRMEHIAHDLTRLIDTANAPIFGIDSEGLVNEWNQTSEIITGFKKDDVFGKDLVKTYITEDYRESVKKVLDDALNGKETANFEFPLFTKDDQRVMVLLNSSARRNEKGKIIGVIGVGQDITELVGYRNELEQKVNERTLKLNKALHKEKELNELKSKFVSTASHEFRTPLSAINFAAGSIKKYWAKMEPIMIEKKLDKIENQVVHMTKLLDDILIVGQADAGKFKNSPRDLNFGNFIYEIIEEVHNSHNKSHEILLIDTEGLTRSNIFIDEKLGRNIFINLISNAIKFSPHAKKVHVELSSKKNHIAISVIDYGIGIYKSELKNIFQPFSRGNNVDLIQGTGLGLSIAKEAIDVIGGKIIVNSTIGNGTSFIVQIPKKN